MHCALLHSFLEQHDYRTQSSQFTVLKNRACRAQIPTRERLRVHELIGSTHAVLAGQEPDPLPPMSSKSLCQHWHTDTHD